MNEHDLKSKLSKIICTLCDEYSEIDNRCVYFTSYEDCPMFNIIVKSLIEAGIGDVSEWKHRAEVAERAVREFAVQVSCKSCPFYCRCGIDSPNAKNDYQECYEAILQQAEKELKARLEKAKNEQM